MSTNPIRPQWTVPETTATASKEDRTPLLTFDGPVSLLDFSNEDLQHGFPMLLRLHAEGAETSQTASANVTSHASTGTGFYNLGLSATGSAGIGPRPLSTFTPFLNASTLQEASIVALLVTLLTVVFFHYVG